MNPPYGREIGKFIAKAYEQSLQGTTVVCLLPARTDTTWWHKYCMQGEIRFLKGRLKFGNSKNSAPFPSAIVIFHGVKDISNIPLIEVIKGSAKILNGDCREALEIIQAESIQSVITSPPYFGLRDYGTARWEGGNPGCLHKAPGKGTKEFGNPEFNLNRPSRKATKTSDYFYRGICQDCGAIRQDQQIGLETDIEDYVNNLVEIFRKVRRVLKASGTVWLNLGDSYGSNKQLNGIPWKVALALQKDGWILRSAIIWHKGNPMPESVKDRPTKSYEMLFLLAKSESYLFNADAIRERAVTSAAEAETKWKTRREDRGKGQKEGVYNGHTSATPFGNPPNPLGRNSRDVWTINPSPYKGAHFAMMPQELVRRCLLAGSGLGDLILDPFAGAGTTGLVACNYGRDFLGIELNGEYVKMAAERLGKAGIAVDYGS
jgi:DNA modification methylase